MTLEILKLVEPQCVDLYKEAMSQDDTCLYTLMQQLSYIAAEIGISVL